MAQLMPLALTVSCFSKIQIGFISLVLADLGSPGKRAVKKRVCVYMTGNMEITSFHSNIVAVLPKDKMSYTTCLTAVDIC